MTENDSPRGSIPAAGECGVVPFPTSIPPFTEKGPLIDVAIDAPLAAFEAEGRKYGAWMARGEIHVVRHAERRGLLTEEVHEKIIKPNLAKNWDRMKRRLFDAGASPNQVEAFTRAALEERGNLLKGDAGGDKH